MAIDIKHVTPRAWALVPSQGTAIGGNGLKRGEYCASPPNLVMVLLAITSAPCMHGDLRDQQWIIYVNGTIGVNYDGRERVNIVLEIKLYASVPCLK